MNVFRSKLHLDTFISPASIFERKEYLGTEGVAVKPGKNQNQNKKPFKLATNAALS